MYSAYQAAMNCKGRPTVILAKTVKGYGLGEAGEGKNISNQQKKMNEKELREFRRRFDIPISDDVIADTPFFRPAPDSEETKYLLARRKALGGFVPARIVKPSTLDVPKLDYFGEFLKGSPKEMSSTKAFVLLLTALLRHKSIGKNIVPIIPDEARTFGMDGLFKDYGIYSPKGQLYEPVDKKSLLYYREMKDGQILEEGISEAGAMSSFIAAGTSYASHGVPMIPFYTYYSMFGPQRVGDQFWLAGDIRAKGFLLGATSGRTSLNGEGLQHQDGHSLLHASTIPTCLPYDPAFGFEISVIIADGMRRMFVENEDIFYYLALYNEEHVMPAMPAGVEDGIVKGLYKFKAGYDGAKIKAHIFGSGSIMQSALKAQMILAEKYGVSADVWSATSYKLLRSDAIRCQRWNILHPTEPPKKSFLETLLVKEQGPFVAVSDNVRTVPDQIAPWVPGGLFTLGTDGFGRSDTRGRLRRFFGVDVESTIIGTLYALAEKKLIDRKVVAQAIKDFGVDPEMVQPQIV
jgi:pyruvate dehydrogenase E1 component